MDIPFVVLPEGLYCPEGEFYVDAQRSVPLCVITHGHGDHARWGHGKNIASKDSEEILRHRLGENIELQSLEYGEKIKLGKAWVSLHPAGHILGSAQVRIEINHKVYVVSGDYKRAIDPTCAPFEVVECDLFITESTFGLPIYRWEDSRKIAKQIYQWWQNNRAENHPSILFCYSLGKAQRILAMLKELSDEQVYLHGAMLSLTDIYAKKGIPMLPYASVTTKDKKESFKHDLILAPPSAAGSPWLKRFPSFRTAAASGWMQVRGMRRRKGMDQGFILSDHADWDDLLLTVQQTKASRILTTHGSTEPLAEYLKEKLALDATELHGLEMVDEDEG